MAAQPEAASAASIARLLSPRSIAVVGASDRPGSLGRLVIENLQRFEYAGDIHLINPTRTEVMGRPCLAKVTDLPTGVDCVVLAVPVGAILAAVQGCVERQVAGIVVFSSGFAELGPEGAALQAEIADLARSNGIALMGPNCLGFINFLDHAPVTFAAADPIPAEGEAVAVLSQSGAMSGVVRAALHSHGLGISLTVSTGNEAVCGIEDFLEYTLARRAAKVIALVIEHVRDPKRFLALADRARREGVVLVLLHPGRSGAARLSAQTHTGAMVGDYQMMRVSVERRGVLMAQTLEELVDLCEFAFRCKKMPFGGVAVMGESGCYKALTLDYADSIGLELPQPKGPSAEILNALAPGLVLATNPMDLTAQGLSDQTMYGKAIEGLMADGQNGSLLVTIILTNRQMARRKMAPILEGLPDWADRWTTVFAMLGEDTEIDQEAIATVRAAGVPFFRSPERALRAIKRYTDWAQTEPAAAAATVPVEPPLPAGVIPEHAAKDALEAAGMPMPKRRLAKTLDDALMAAEEIGFPLVLKVQSPKASHKSDIGGVILNVADTDALAAAWTKMQGVIEANNLASSLDGVLIENMSRPGLELIVGARNDPDWGALVSVGFGGVEAEIVNDVVQLSPDLSLEEIKAGLMTLKRAPLFGAFRGREPRDLDAVAKAVKAVSRFMQAHPEVKELDINPLIVLPKGQGVAALDALMVAD